MIPLPSTWLLIACSVLAGLLGLQTIRISNLKAEYADQEAARATSLTVAVKADATKAATHAAATVENANALLKYDATRAAALRDTDRLRDTVRARIAQPSTPDAAACNSRAATLGQLLDEAVGVARDNTLAAEQHADELRVCLNQLKIDRERYAVKE
jgi:hypothetical protein